MPEVPTTRCAGLPAPAFRRNRVCCWKASGPGQPSLDPHSPSRLPLPAAAYRLVLTPAVPQVWSSLIPAAKVLEMLLVNGMIYVAKAGSDQWVAETGVR